MAKTTENYNFEQVECDSVSGELLATKPILETTHNTPTKWDHKNDSFNIMYKSSTALMGKTLVKTAAVLAGTFDTP